MIAAARATNTGSRTQRRKGRTGVIRKTGSVIAFHYRTLCSLESFTISPKNQTVAGKYQGFSLWNFPSLPLPSPALSLVSFSPSKYINLRVQLDSYVNLNAEMSPLPPLHQYQTLQTRHFPPKPRA